MTATHPHLALMDRALVDITEVDRAESLIAQLREANEHRGDAVGGIVWFFQIGPDDDDDCVPCLLADVRGEVGSLHWCEGQQSMTPVDGINPDYVDYWLPGGHHAPQDPGSELPIERVYEAVAEWVRTRERPTCVEWRDAG